MLISMECGMSEVLHTSLSGVKGILESFETDSLIIIVDLNVQNLYSKQLDLLNVKGKKVTLWKAPPGENAKNFEEYERCIEFVIEKGIHRKSHVVAIGGGATSDFAGFVASTVLRGVSWSVVPTTLLSMIDASIGGKVGINSQFGKNLVGNFHLPQKIIVANEFLETLPEDEYQSGLGEMLKYCFLDQEIGNKLKETLNHKDLIDDCMAYKHKIVEEDLKENGRRKLLNFGHTFGHAIERIYDLKHGIAVVWGIVLIMKMYGTQEQVSKMKEFIALLGLNLDLPPWYNKTFQTAEIMNYLTKDKKAQSTNNVDLVVPDSKNEIVVKARTFDEINEDLAKNAEELRTFRLH